MATNKTRKEFENPKIDEQFLMDIMSGDKPMPDKASEKQEPHKSERVAEKLKTKAGRKVDYQDTFLVNRFPSGRNGKVVYIRTEFHERLLRIVQLGREDKVTLYSYIDNILEYHFREFGEEIIAYFNDNFKPIL